MFDVLQQVQPIFARFSNANIVQMSEMQSLLCHFTTSAAYIRKVSLANLTKCFHIQSKYQLKINKS